jgi:hypothetical protein
MDGEDFSGVFEVYWFAFSSLDVAFVNLLFTKSEGNDLKADLVNSRIAV